MKHILVGTNRPNSRSLDVAKLMQQLFTADGQDCEIIELEKIPLQQLSGSHYAEDKPAGVASAIEKINSSEGLMVICPEYNGSMPGALKYFIDYWSYPDSFESRPVAFVGLGGTFGGLRPVEHLQQVFGYRNAYIFPERIFLTNIWNSLQDGKIIDDKITPLMEKQVKNFGRFVSALQQAGLDANSNKS